MTNNESCSTEGQEEKMIKEVGQVSKTISESLQWVDRVVGYFKSYKPVTKSMTINYKNLNAEIGLSLYIPDSTKRTFVRKVEIPAYQNFEISDMMDESFNRIGELWRLEDEKWKLDVSKLPHCEHFLVKMKGKIPKQTLSKIVLVQPSANRDITEEFDKYWLSAMIRDVEAIENMWSKLEIDDVTTNVKVGIDRCFSIVLPKELKELIEADRRWIRAGRYKDREEVSKAWNVLRRLSDRHSISPYDVVELFDKLTDRDTFSKFIFADDPYSIGDIKRNEVYRGTFPDGVYTEAVTFLSLKRPTAKGHLTFKKKEYINEIKSKIEKL